MLGVCGEPYWLWRPISKMINIQLSLSVRIGQEPRMLVGQSPSNSYRLFSIR